MNGRWRSRVCGAGTPLENNATRRTALAAWTDRDVEGLGWAASPVINDGTRLTVEMCPVDGSLFVAGWEADGRNGAAPVTAFTEVA